MIAIIGGGISGLAVAYELQKWCEPCIVLEAASTPGGVIQTELTNKHIVEYGANSILVDEELKKYLVKLGLEDKFVNAEDVGKNRFIYKNGKLRKLPSGPKSVFFGDFLSGTAKASILKELFKKPAPKEGETLDEFITRRFSTEISDYILTPFISGIYAGDPKKLLVEKTFPFLQKYEEEYGSVLKGFMKNKGSVRKESLYFRSGMQDMIRALVDKVKNLKLNTSVESIRKVDDGYSLKVISNGKLEEIHCEGVVLSAPSFVSADIVKNEFPLFADALKRVNYAPLVKVFLSYKKSQVKKELKGFGALFPACENQYIIGSVWNSSIYPHVAPDDEILITSMVGGSIQPGHTEMKDEYILNKVKHDIAEYYKIEGEPCYSSFKRIDKAVPQYDDAIIDVEEHAKFLEKENVYVCSNWIGGPALSDCIKKAQKMAIKITEARAGIAEYKGCC